MKSFIVEYKPRGSESTVSTVVNARAPQYRAHGEKEPADVRILRRFPTVSNLDCTVVRVTPK